MSSSFKIADGDLVTLGSGLAIVSGAEKLIQDLEFWMKETYQEDRFHPRFGSTLESMVGQVIDDETAFYVETEVRRVLQNYQNAQLQGLQSRPEIYSDDELLDTIKDVSVDIELDKVFVSISVITVSGRVVNKVIGVTV